MQMHVNPPRATRRGRRIVTRDYDGLSSGAQESAIGIAAIWLIFYLVIYGAGNGCGKRGGCHPSLRLPRARRARICSDGVDHRF